MLTSALAYYASWIFGMVFPIYASFKAIESKDPTDDVQWLTYWAVYATINALEIFLSPVVAWIPFYYEVKCLFVMWLISPQSKGAAQLYKQQLRPFLYKHEKQIDVAYDEANQLLAKAPLSDVHFDSDTSAKGAALLSNATAVLKDQTPFKSTKAYFKDSTVTN